MRKVSTLVLSLLALIAIGSGFAATRLVQLVVVNKSGRGVEISLTGKEKDYSYYLRVPEGDRESPAEKVFTIIPDTYTTNLYYVELWDPVYGYSCSSKKQTLEATRNIRLVVVECDRTPSNGGEPPSIIKYGSRDQRRP